MSIRESLIKYLTSILRASEGTLLVVLCDLDGLSIAKIGRKSEYAINPNHITSLASTAFSVSEENWEDLDIKDQIISFTYFESVCLVTIKINDTLLTIVHDYHKDWPLDADSIASAMYYLKKKLTDFFEGKESSQGALEQFSNNLRSAIYLLGMGSEIPFKSYTPESYEQSNILPTISNIFDSIKNPVYLRYCLANPSGLLVEARDLMGDNLPITIEAFAANAMVAFQKMKEESEQSNLGNLLNYIAISGLDSENLYGLITVPSGVVNFSNNDESAIKEKTYFISLFSLEYGGIPIIGETRNIVYSILEILGNEVITEKFIKSANILMKNRYE